MGAEAEVLDSLAGVLGTTEEKGVGTGGGTESELVEGQALAASLLNASAGGSGEAESGDRELRNSKEAVVVGDSANDNDGLALVGLAGLLACSHGGDARDGHGRAVDAGHKKAAEDDLVEVGIGTAYNLREGQRSVTVWILSIRQLLVQRMNLRAKKRYNLTSNFK